MRLFLLLAFLIFSVPVFAQGADTVDAGNTPIDISADTALEWDREGAKYIARGNARAAQGETVVLGDILTAHYDPSGDGATDLTELHADKNVQIINGAATVSGDHAVYNLLDETAKVTGDNLKMTNEDMVVTANDHFIYDAGAGTVTAVGNAVVTQGDKKLKTQKLTAYLEQNTDGKSEIKRIEAPGAVTITTPTEVIVGNRGSYNVAGDKAVLTGDVKITQDKNELTGQKAEVNMTTGVSKMFAGENKDGSDGRVRGIFYPKDKDK